jgi:pyridoxal phosphate enzyme (YggS family)
MSDEIDVGATIQAIRRQIENAELAADRRPGSARLIAVSKTQPADAIRSALDAGHRLFGENRVQEAAAKWPALKADFPDAEVHLIGPLQSNKVKQAVALFDVIQTLDRPKLARALAAEFDRSGRRLKCFIQINIGEEAQKAGVGPAQADGFIAACRDDLGLPIVGLMCIPPLDAEPAPYFALLAKTAARNDLDGVSMGMSADFETAIAFGATCVRVGSAIFGARAP